AKCSPGDELESAQWHSLGEGAVVPYDNDAIGEGEMEGNAQSAAEAARAAEGDGHDRLEDQLAGKSADDLVAALKAATPTQMVKLSGDSTADCS
ncbi:hypothetical protein ABZV38_40170, partial [Streptomyces sp. NPDC005181]